MRAADVAAAAVGGAFGGLIYGGLGAWAGSTADSHPVIKGALVTSVATGTIATILYIVADDLQNSAPSVSSGVGGFLSMTPAQASGHPNFVTDHATQGPTDEGLRAADCWFAKNRLPARPACADCGESKPMQGQSLLAGVAGEQLSYRSKGSRAFALADPGNLEIWNSKMNADQQAWVLSTLATLNANIVKATGTMCPGWVAPSGASGVGSATGCFQSWWNSQYPPGSGVKQLPTNGIFDQDTLDALQTITKLHPTDFPTPYPASKKLSTATMVGIAAAAAATLGTVGYVMYKPKKKSRSRRKGR